MKCVDHAKTLAAMALLIKLARRSVLRSQNSEAEVLARSQHVLHQDPQSQRIAIVMPTAAIAKSVTVPGNALLIQSVTLKAEHTLGFKTMF